MAFLVFLSASTPTQVVSTQFGHLLGGVGPSQQFAEKRHNNSFLDPIPFLGKSARSFSKSFQ
jgi:hypothetical protein